MEAAFAGYLSPSLIFQVVVVTFPAKGLFGRLFKILFCLLFPKLFLRTTIRLGLFRIQHNIYKLKDYFEK